MLRLLAPILLASSALAATAEEWQNRTIYQLVTDRFATSDGSSPACDTSERVYCGGSWKGVTNKLDYIQGMGFDAVWISPLVANIEGNTTYGEAYHGYWPQDINSLNSHYGSAADLKALSAALHSRGMYLMIDVVVNHLVNTGDPPDFSKFTPFNTQSDFHSECFVINYDNQTEVEQCWLGDKQVPLVDLNTEDDSIVSTMNNWVKGLVTDYNADGVRIDTVKHVRKDFWPAFASSAGTFTIGEVLSNETSYVAPYTQVLDGVLDYPMWYPLVAGFQTPYGNLSYLAEVFATSQSVYKNGEKFSGSFLENHDQPRFQSLTQDQALVKNAMAWPFVNDGIPILYYGQEQAYAGSSDPSNREALWLSGYYTDKDLVKHVTALTGARKAAMAANSKFLSTAATARAASTSALALSKPPLLALFTNVGTNGSSTSWTVSDAGYAANEALVDVLSCATLTADSSGGVAATSSGGLPQVIVPASALTKGGSLCGDQATGSGSATQGNTSGARGVFAAAVPVAVAVAVGAVLVASQSGVLGGWM